MAIIDIDEYAIEEAKQEIVELLAAKKIPIRFIDEIFAGAKARIFFQPVVPDVLQAP